MNLVVFGTLLLCGFQVISGQDSINSDLVNTKVQRTVDLTTHLVKINNRITVENTGKTGVRSYLIAIDPNLADYLAFVGATLKSGSDEERKLAVEKASVANQKGDFYRITLPFAFDAGKELTLDVETVFSHALHPYPTHITQSEKQLVKFVGNVYFYSPYRTQSLTTVVTCSSSSIDSYTKEKPVTSSDKTITYGPHENVEPFKQVELVVHYENNTPFLTVTRMTRVIELSHWGNIAVEETYDLVHSGAILKGPFSRYDYQRNQDGVNSVKSFKTVLPPSAKDVYYRDEIGNISTSHLHDTDDGVELELRPRFPLFGGWKTNYYIGYNVPSYQYLFNSGDQYALLMKFIDHVFDDQLVDQLTVKVILPEGSKNIRVKTPYPVTREADSLHYTYLDTVGRPVITMKKNNLVEMHIQDFELRYTFPKYMLFQEPLLVVAAFYLLFVLVIVYVRMDFAISKDEASESRMRVASLIEQAQTAHDRRSALYQSYEDAINKFKSTKDANTFSANRKKIEADHKALTNQFTTLLGKLKTEGSEASDKLGELQKLDGQVREQMLQSIQLAEKLVNGRLNKAQYVDLEAAIRVKKDDYYQKMDNILASL
jgi:oligosaccharyltransferase complex subunit alpha (ribophorin I)